MEVPTYGKAVYNLKFGYSNNLMIMGYLIRCEPFTSEMIRFIDKFDQTDRIFGSLNKSFKNVLKTTQCNSELTPEFFY